MIGKSILVSRISAAALLLAAANSPAQAGFWDDLLNSLGGNEELQTAINPADIADGLRAALAKGTRSAVLDLGRTDGFWAQQQYQVPLPSPVAKAQKLLQQVGAGAQVEDFHLALNRAAEQAVPVAADIFSRAVSKMTIQDAQQILNGPEDAATQFFRRTTADELQAQFLPLVSKATADHALALQYRQMVSAAGPFSSMLGEAADLDQFVTRQALDAVFDRVAVEEAKIRRDPAARTSEILQQVFGKP